MNELVSLPKESIIFLLFILIIAFTGLNGLIYLILYFINKERILKKLTLCWLLFLLAFITQFVVQSNELNIIFAYSTITPPLLMLADITFFSFHKKFPLIKYLLIWMIAFPITWGLSIFNVNFFALALPFTISSALPLLISTIQIFSKRDRPPTNMEILLGLILIFSTVHCVNFAIFRMQEGAQFWGWTSTFFLAQGLAIIFPSYSIELMARTEKNRLENLVEIRTKEKSNLLRIILHDLITPLNCIWDYIEGWKNKEVEEERAFTKINMFMDEIQQIIKEVREIETNKVGKKNLPMEPLNIHQCLKESLEKLQKEIREKNIKINFPEPNNDPLFIRGNKSLLENSIFGNLLKNSIKFSDLGGSISIKVEDNLNSIQIHIRDEGIGIPKYLMDNLFIHGATNSRKGTMGETGSGLGLLILKEAINMLKGKLRIRSKSIDENKTNHGTIVSLTFPKIKNNNGEKNAFNNS